MQPYHIMIVDDEPDLRRIVEVVLTRTIYPNAQFSLLGNGQAALSAFQETGANLVITDYNMPKMAVLN